MEEQKQEIQKQNNWLMPASILIAGLFIAIAVVYSNGAKNINPSQQANLNQENQVKNTAPKIEADDVVLGNSDAKVTIIEFGDYQCPFCAKFYKEIELFLKRDYIDNGKVKMVFKPLAFLDRNSSIKESQNAVIAVKCAQEQDKFWQMHDKIFETEYNEVKKVIAKQLETNEGNGNLIKEFFQKTSGELGMNTNDFLNCYNSGKYKNIYADNMKEAEIALPQGVGTPAVFINGEKVKLDMNSEWQYEYDKFKDVVDKFLNDN